MQNACYEWCKYIPVQKKSIKNKFMYLSSFEDKISNKQGYKIKSRCILVASGTIHIKGIYKILINTLAKIQNTWMTLRIVQVWNKGVFSNYPLNLLNTRQ